MNALLIGCGSKWGGNFFLPEIKKEYDVTLITGSNFEDPDVDVHKMEWDRLSYTWIREFCSKIGDRHFDLIFFNHNSGGGPGAEYFRSDGPMINIADWNKQLYIHNQFPPLLIRALSSNMNKNTKVGWMLTGMIKESNPEHYEYGLYGAAKYTNLAIMRLFSQNHHGIFFGLNPWWFPPGEEQIRAEDICKTISKLTSEHNGKALTADGRDWY